MAEECLSLRGRKFMISTDYDSFRNTLEFFLDKVTDCSETVLVAGENNKNVVLLSEKSYSNMMENIHAMGSEANYSWLIESKKQLENGSASPHELID